MNKRASKIGLFVLIATAAIIAAAMAQGPRFQESKPTTAYIVGGIRHGISHFPKTDTPFIRPKAAGVMDFAHYHTYDEVCAFLKKWAADRPDIVDLYSVGKSFE